ncbi:hypothetical protein ACHAXA_006768 [Cyclostephanos tholiformis]|uniref:RNA helicase n=1 Tax=Cyclostephanos tholiformis TaxID=382380 RepID=A0ABD3SRX1_9STRA
MTMDGVTTTTTTEGEPPPKRRRRGRWDVKEEGRGDDYRRATSQEPMMVVVAGDDNINNLAGDGSIEEGVNDALDAFMMRLEAGDAAAVDGDDDHDDIARMSGGSSLENGGLSSTAADDRSRRDRRSQHPVSSYIDSSGSMVRMARTSVKADIRAMSNVPVAASSSSSSMGVAAPSNAETSATTTTATASAIDVGRMYNDGEGGVMEEAERTLAALTAAPDALEVLAEMNKKKELRSVDHESVDYLPIRKNLYIVPRSLASLTPTEVAERRARLGVKVRGKGAPAPVSKFSEAGLSERILSVLEKKCGITDPYPIQAQCLPCIMAGRDVIGIAKTGSGKTLAFVLPMLRHILDQPPLAPNETGPIGLILAPARELAYQIHVVCKGLTKFLGLKSTAVYGGAGVAEQISDLKRGTHILCATPGRLIDILTMQSGKLISLQRVSMVCLDESDRAFDMGFEPQISAILAAVRPDRQMVMFSATFPKAVENLAKKSLRSPLEIIVGGRSVASDSVDQYAEMIEEEDKFLRLLQILGEHADGGKKVIVFVGRQEQADSLFEQLTRCGYSSLSIHGGMDQEDRDSNMSDFKRTDGPQLLVATSVAGRGLDVPSCGCVVNYSSPNHLEDYVHRVGRTGRANNRGVAYTFVNSTDEAKFAPIVVRALVEAGQSKNLSQELKDLSESFKEKVSKGEARWASSGYQGKGYTYDSSEISDAQKLAKLEKQQVLIEAGLLDPDEEESKDQDQDDKADSGEAGAKGRPNASGIGKMDAVGMLANVSADVLAIPGMREALMKKAGMLPADDGPTAMGENHFVEELEINDYPQQARWKVTQKETTSRLQDEFQTAVTLKGLYIESGKTPPEGERKLYLHLEAQSSQILQNCILEIKRLLNEETLRVGARSAGGGGRYSVM